MLEVANSVNSLQMQTLQTVCQALQNEVAVAFVKASVKEGYHVCTRVEMDKISTLVDGTFDKLAQSQREAINPRQLVVVTGSLLQQTFRKNDHAFWFNQLYHQYKTKLKPEADSQQLEPLILGSRVLDYGCGSGYLALQLAQSGYDVLLTDVLDYRYPEAQHLPFRQMASPTDIPYQSESVDTALVQSVLHHIETGDLPVVLQRLSRIATRVLIKEDSYDLRDNLPGLAEKTVQQPLLQWFVTFSQQTQYQVLVLLDYYANAIAQGIPEMNMPFAFRSVVEWQEILSVNGFRVNQTLLAGFEPGRMHMSCHVWFVCERQ